ncbi:MAG: Stp1/IreP family PP2C-type Ser/Thr phosphatase [Actinobacteria bacterium]|nr:MAG: Stp1/IreP family PP2C-type Ser/Thr phosphatase [Actinomycetota bacterium]
MKHASATHVGRVRQDNEDYIIAQDGIYIVADGMGGHDAGDVASKTAAQAALRVIESSKDEDKLATLKKAVEAANKKVLERSEQMQVSSGMGTTLTAALINGLKAYLAHIGDSRAYLLRENKLSQLTEDHSLVADMVREGKLKEKEAREHPYRNVITRAIGGDAKIDVDVFSYDLKPGDKILLASDGLTGLVTDAQIQKIISSTDKLSKTCQNLIKKANDEGGQDNISVVLVDVSDGKINSFIPKKRSRIKTKVGVLTLILLAFFGLLFTGLYINKNSFYLSTNKRKVALYQGIPYKILGLKFSKVEYTSDVKYKELDKAMKKRLSKKIVVRNKKEGLAAIDDMAEEVDK